MKNITRGLAAVATLTLALGGVALGAGAAQADEITPVDPPIVEVIPEADPIVEDTAAKVQEKEPDVGYHLVLWQTDTINVLWPQHIVADEVQPEPDINGLDEFATCGTYQADLYRDDDATAALIAGGFLTSPGNPYESWPGDGYNESYSKQWTVTEGCETPEFPTTECAAFDVLPTATAENPHGWGDLQNGTWTKDGIQLTATADQAAFAYVAVDNIPLSSTVNGLTTHGTGTSVAQIIHTPNYNVHKEADGQYWTKSGPGLFPETSPGFYSTYDLGEMQQEVYIDEVAIWVNPGESFLVTSQDYPCVNQPFGAEVPPTTDLPTPPVTPELAYTGSADPMVNAGLGGMLAIALIVGGIALKRRFQ